MKLLDRLLARYPLYFRWRNKYLIKRMQRREFERRSQASIKGWQRRQT